MRVFALGGYGRVGLPTCSLLARCDVVTEIAIAGRDLDHAETAATEIGEKAVPLVVDGSDGQALSSAVAGFDIIVNTTHDATQAVRAAIRTGAHYCDVAHGTAAEQARRLAPEAASAGITAIICNGIAPGIINLMGVHAADQLEEVEQVVLGRADLIDLGKDLTPQRWISNPNESLDELHEYRWFVALMMRRLQDNGVRSAVVYQDGRWVATDPVRNGWEVPLLEGGSVTAFPFVSGESPWDSLTPGRSKVPPIEVWFSPFPPQLHDLLREHALSVLEEHVDAESATDSFFDAVAHDPHRRLALLDDFPALPQLWVTAVGRKETRAARHTCWFNAAGGNLGGWYLTSAALAAAVVEVLRGEVGERGVMKADSVFDPLSFLEDVVDLLPERPPDGRLINESFQWLE